MKPSALTATHHLLEKEVSNVLEYTQPLEEKESWQHLHETQTQASSESQVPRQGQAGGWGEGEGRTATAKPQHF